MGIIREISIAETDYSLSPYVERPYSRKAQSPIIGQDKERYWFTWPTRTWHAGERMQRILTSADMESGRYHDGEGVNTTEWGELTLQPALARSVAVQSTHLPMVVNSTGTKVVIGTAVSPYCKIGTYSSETNTLTFANPATTAPSAALIDLVVAGSTIYGVTSDGAVVSTTNNGDTWAAYGAYTGALGLAYVNSKLYVLKSTQVYDDDGEEELSSQGGAFIAGFREKLYWANDRRIWIYDGNADYEYCKLPEGFNVTALIPYRMALWVLGYYKCQGGYKGEVHYIMPGTENHLYSLGDYSADYRIKAACGGDDEVWFASPKRGGADRFSMESGGIACGPAWAAAGNIPFKSMASVEGFLVIGRYDDVAGTDGIYVADIASPATYRSSGWVTSPAFDFGYAYDKKVVRSIRIAHDALVAGQSIKIEYSTDYGTNYTIAGTNGDLGSTAYEWTLPSVVSETIKLRVTLTAGTSLLTTPKLRTVTVQAAPRLNKRWRWDLELMASRKNRGASDKEDLEAAFISGVPVSFADRDGREYTVVVEDIDFQEVIKDSSSAIIVLSLRQV